MTAAMRAAHAPPPRARPSLPLSVREGLLREIDWRTTSIVAMSFLLHFGLVGAMFSDWADPVVGEDVTTGGLIDLMKSLPPDPVELPTEFSEASAPSVPRVAPSAAHQAQAADAHEAPTHGTRTDVAARARAEEARFAWLAAQASAMHMEMLGTGRSGTAVDQVLRRSELPSIDLDGAAATVAGAEHGSGDIRLAGAAGPVHPSSVSCRLCGLATTHEKSDGGAGHETKIAGPAIEVITEPAIGTVANAERVIAALRPGFHACFTRGLDEDSSMTGKVILLATIAANGEVSSVDVEINSGISPFVTACLVRRVRGAQFDKPDQNRATIRIPLVLLRQAR
jgi:hypothetical protein